MMNTVLPTSSLFFRAEQRQMISDQASVAYSICAEPRFCLADTYLLPKGKMAVGQSAFTSTFYIAILGGLLVENGEGEIAALQGADIACFASDTLVQISNPFDEAIHFISLQIPSVASFQNGAISPIDIVQKNRLYQAEEGFKSFYIGIYDCKEEDVWVNEQGETLIYIISGSFEVEGRLMGQGDALLLSASSSIELESLAEAAIILVLSLPATTQ